MAVVAGPMTSADAQGAGYVQCLIIGSEGRGSVRIAEAEEGMEDLENAFVKALGLRPKLPVEIQMTKTSGSVLERISLLHAHMESSDLLVAVCRGGWEADSSVPEFARLVSPEKEKITIDYLHNTMQFMPALDGVLFVLPPPPQELSPTLFAGTTEGVNGGGKYIVIVRFRGQSAYPVALSAFQDVITDLSSIDQADANKDGNISFAEWLSECRRRLEKTFVVQVYKVSDSPDVPIRQLR